MDWRRDPEDESAVRRALDEFDLDAIELKPESETDR
jgi:hypothetical protein